MGLKCFISTKFQIFSSIKRIFMHKITGEKIENRNKHKVFSKSNSKLYSISLKVALENPLKLSKDLLVENNSCTDGSLFHLMSPSRFENAKREYLNFSEMPLITREENFIFFIFLCKKGWSLFGNVRQKLQILSSFFLATQFQITVNVFFCVILHLHILSYNILGKRKKRQQKKIPI